MIEAERHQVIINRVKEKGIVSVSDLSDLFQVSQNTIRRDLQKLEKNEVIKRTHGGAILKEFYNLDLPFATREDKYRKEKQAIGYKASQIINSGDNIILDAGTTTAQIAKNIKNKRDLTIITNAVNIALELANCREIITILTGGIIREITNCLVGFQAEEFLKKTHVDKTFLAAGGVTIEEGLTNPNPFEVGVKKVMIEAAKEVILVVAHNKFENVALTPIAPIEAVHKIITDKEVSPEYLGVFQQKGIEVILA